MLKDKKQTNKSKGVERPSFITEEQDQILRRYVRKKLLESKLLKESKLVTEKDDVDKKSAPTSGKTPVKANLKPAGTKPPMASTTVKYGDKKAEPSKPSVDKDKKSPELSKTNVDKDGKLNVNPEALNTNNEYKQLKQRIFIFLRKNGVSTFEANNLLNIANDFIEETVGNGFSRQDVFITKKFMNKYISNN